MSNREHMRFIKNTAYDLLIPGDPFRIGDTDKYISTFVLPVGTIIYRGGGFYMRCFRKL